MTLPSRIDYLSISSNENKWTQAKDSFHGDSVPPEKKLADNDWKSWGNIQLKVGLVGGLYFAKWLFFRHNYFDYSIRLGCGQICQFSLKIFHQWRINKTEVVNDVNLIDNF